MFPLLKGYLVDTFHDTNPMKNVQHSNHAHNTMKLSYFCMIIFDTNLSVSSHHSQSSIQSSRKFPIYTISYMPMDVGSGCWSAKQVEKQVSVRCVVRCQEQQ